MSELLSLKWAGREGILIILLLVYLGFFSIPAKGQDVNNDEIAPPHPVYLKYHLDTLKSSTGEISTIDSSSLQPYHIVYFDFRAKTGSPPWPYGFGYLIVDVSLREHKVLWYNLIYGDFGPHTISWIDFDNDGDKDLYYLIGYEDIFGSYLYLNQMNTNPSVPFKQAYVNGNGYCALVDINTDGIPEILNQLSSDDNYWYDYRIKQKDREEIAKEYDKIIGKFDKCNFDYNMRDSYKVFSIDVISEVNILAVSKDTTIDVSSHFPEHFCFREKILKRVKPLNTQARQRFRALRRKYKAICNAQR